MAYKQSPKHVALSIECSDEQNLDLRPIHELIKTCVAQKIPILTINLCSAINETDILTWFFSSLKGWTYITENQIKVSVLGKWYSLPSRLVEPIKAIIAETKDYDAFFVNFCLNYDGQEEIVDACKLVSMQVKLDKLDPENIDKQTIKENTYSSFFMPPDLIIKTGKTRTTEGFLLWDSANAKIIFTDKKWRDFSQKDFVRAVESWEKI